MTLKRGRYLLFLGGAAVVAGCSYDTDGEPVTPTIVAGLRYVNIVPDTVGMDIRVVDVVGDAPNTVNATFRTGGSPYGVGVVGLPLHTAVQAGTRSIRAFLSSGNPAVASRIMLDTTLTFDANTNYTVYLWGYANPANGTPTLSAMVVKDSVPTLDTGQVAIRTIHFAPTLAPTLAAPAVDVTVDTLAAAAVPTSGAAATYRAAFTNVAPGDVRPYQIVRRRLAVTGPPAIPALNFRAAVAGNATPTTLAFSGDVPNGTVGTSTANPVAGDLIGGSALSVLVVPRSVAGTGASTFTTPAVLFIVDQRPPRTAP